VLVQGLIAELVDAGLDDTDATVIDPTLRPIPRSTRPRESQMLLHPPSR